jgi:GT2 family glycosyltransferase
VSIAVVIPTLDRHSYLRALLADLQSQELQPSEVVVVDQSARIEESALESYRRYKRRLRLSVFTSRPLGPAAARNLGFSKTDSDTVVFLDDDVRIEPNHLRGHQRWYGYPFVHGIAGGVDSGDFFPPSWGAWDVMSAITATPSARSPRPVIGFGAANFSTRRSTFEAIGGFDERYRRSGEDRDLGIRYWESGKLIVQDPRLACSHQRAPHGGLRSRASGYSLRGRDPGKFLLYMQHFHWSHRWLYLLIQLYREPQSARSIFLANRLARAAYKAGPLLLSRSRHSWGTLN